MPARRSLLLLLLTCSLIAPLRHARAAVDRAEPRVPRQRMSPMVAELYDALDEQRVVVRAMRLELARATDPARQLELRRSIAAAKQATELRLLRIQASHARREGRLQTAQELDAAITALSAPPPTREPLERAAPRTEAVR